MSKSKVLFVLFIIAFLVKSSFSQKKEKELFFSYGQNTVKFFDKTKFAYLPYQKGADNISYISFRLASTFSIEKINQFKIEYSGIGITYPYENCNGCVPLSSVISRNFFQINLTYLRKLLSTKNGELFSSVGFSYRNGFEEDFISFPRVFEIQTYPYSLSDVGLNFGFTYYHYFSNYWGFNSIIDLNYFLINKSNKTDFINSYPFLNGTTKGYLNAGIGLFLKFSN